MTDQEFKEHCEKRETPKQLINFQRDTSKVHQFDNPDASTVEEYKVVFWNDYLKLNKGKAR